MELTQRQFFCDRKCGNFVRSSFVFRCHSLHQNSRRLGVKSFWQNNVRTELRKNTTLKTHQSTFAAHKKHFRQKSLQESTPVACRNTKSVRLRIFPVSQQYFSRFRDFFGYDLVFFPFPVFFSFPGYFFRFRKDFSCFGKRYFSSIRKDLSRFGKNPRTKIFFTFPVFFGFPKKKPLPRGIFPLRRGV